MRSELRPHQQQAMADLRRSVASGKKRPLIQAPTGAGKTVIAAAVVDGALAKGNKICFVVPALSLIDQTVMAFHREGISEVGVIQADHWMTDWSKPVQVASIQTLARRTRPEADVVVVDEAHRMFKTMNDWMGDQGWKNTPFIGLSATPWTKGMGKHYDDLIIAATTRKLIDDGYLSDFRVFAPAHPDLTGVKTVAGDYHEGQLGEVMGDAALVADVVETWLRLGEDRPTLVFGVDRAHAKKLADRFEQAGVAAAYQDAFTDGAERASIAQRFRQGDIRVVCNVGTLTTGVDWDVRCIVLARPTRSEMLHVQIIGRGLRTAEGKADCLILDHADNNLRLGFVTDIHHETLDAGTERRNAKRERKEVLPKECPSCSFLKPAKVRICPACGFAPEVKSGVEEEDGELVEVKAGKGKAKADKATKQLWFSGLLHICQVRGYKPGWAANQYRNKFGVWPRGLAEVITDPPQEVWNFVKAGQIRYAKRREKAQREVRHAV